MAVITPKTRYARDGDISIAWQEIGHGDVDLLLAPGFISHLDLNWVQPSFAAFVDYLAQFARVLLFDKRGTGLSDPSPDAAVFERRMRDIELVLDAAGSEQPVIFGQSEGGPLACLFAATHPERVRSLILFGTFARGSIIPQETVQRFEAAVDDWGEGHTAGIFLSGSDGPVARRFIGMYERAAASPGTARALLRSICQCDVTGVLPDITAPSLVMHRIHDPFAQREWSEELAALLPQAEHRELPGNDHLAWMGDPVDLVQAIEEWVTGHEPTPPSRRRFATVLLTDIVESTQQLASAGDLEWAHIVEAHNDESWARFEQYGAWSVNGRGDGFLACFDTPEAATRCAWDLHRDMARLGIEIRAGLHSGEVERVDVDDVAGMTVHIAARVSDLAGAGETLATRAVSDLLTGTPVTVLDRGEEELKGVPDRVPIVELIPTPEAVAAADETRTDLGLIDTVMLNVLRTSPTLARNIARLAGAK